MEKKTQDLITSLAPLSWDLLPSLGTQSLLFFYFNKLSHFTYLLSLSLIFILQNYETKTAGSDEASLVT
jgi:hypothetical protein